MTSSPPLVTGTEVAETNTSFLEVWDIYLQSGPFFGNCSKSPNWYCWGSASTSKPQWHYLLLPGWSPFSFWAIPASSSCDWAWRAYQSGAERRTCRWSTLLLWAWTPWCGVSWRWSPGSIPSRKCCGTGGGPWDNGHPIPRSWYWILEPLWLLR